MPDLHHQLAGHCRHGNVAVACAGKKLPSPFAQLRMPAHPQHRLRALDQEMAHVAAATLADAELDLLAGAALSLPGIESKVGNQFFWAGEASHLTNDCQKGKGVDYTNAKQFHTAHHQRLGANLPANEPPQFGATLV